MSWSTRSRTWALALCIASGCSICSFLPAAEAVRSYPMGEEDNGAAIGDEASFTADIIESADDVEPIIDLEGFGTYVAGRNADSPLAIAFDGSTDFFEAAPFDPRDFDSFAALSQGWFKPSPDGEGLPQTLWGLGNDNGGVGITEDGFWQLNSGGSAGSAASETPVVFDKWVHLAVLRGGNGGTLYVDGSVIATNDGFWNGPGTFYLGAGVDGSDPFAGVIDDFLISGFADGSFDPAVDIKFLDATVLSGVFGDVTQDGLVDQADYDAWSENMGFDNSQGVGDFSSLFLGDVDQNGAVNFFDFEVIRDVALAAGTPIAVPEPSAGSLLFVSLLGLLTLRRSVVRRNKR